MHIVLANAHWNNRGDEAAHRALWQGLRQKYPGCRITVMFKDRETIRQFPRLENAEYFPCQFKAAFWDIWLATLTRGWIGRNALLKKAVRTLKTADLIVYSPGGAVISDRFFWSKQMEYLVPFLCARLYRIPMFVAAPSFGPFDLSRQRRLRTWLLRTPKVICVREAISREYLEGIGVRDNVHVTMDLAFLDTVDVAANEKKLDAYPALRSFMESHDKVVGITITDFKWHVKLGKDRELAARINNTFMQMIDALVRKGYGVLMIPQLFGNQNDCEALNAYKLGEDMFVMSDEPDTYFQQYVISKLYALIGMRYHSNIFAAKMGTPFVAVAYEEKMSGFMELAGLTDWAIPLEMLTFAQLEEKVHALDANYEEFRRILVDRGTLWQMKACKAVELLPASLSGLSIAYEKGSPA